MKLDVYGDIVGVSAGGKEEKEVLPRIRGMYADKGVDL
jgi:hypothetical protein